MARVLFALFFLALALVPFALSGSDGREVPTAAETHAPASAEDAHMDTEADDVARLGAPVGS